MHVGCGHSIDNKWIPENISTGLTDIHGVELKTSNHVKLRGCRSDTAIVGQDEKGFVLFFGTDNGSCMWHLNTDTIKEHHIELVTGCKF